MKRLSNSASASLGAFMSIVSNSTEHDTMGDNDSDNSMYARAEYHQPAMMGGGYEEDPCMEQDSSGLGGSSEKKRRLSVDQVKALEKNFEVENKLEPEMKVRLAQELGLQPRQVAVWFQNRRARWKTKQLERDYGMLKASYDGLKLNFDKLQHDNEALVKQIRELRSKVNEDGPDGDSHSKQSGDKEDELMSYCEEKSKKLQTPVTPKPDKDSDSENMNSDKNGAMIILGSGDFKDGSSDSDNSSTILNDDNINNNRHGSSPRQHQFLEIDVDRNNNNYLNTSFQIQEPGKAVFAHQSHHQQPQQYVKLEEHNFLGEDPCSTFFSDDQPPSLHWYEWS